MSFESARAIADAVLLEGYVLYPYRASSAKNRYRWTFGVLAPHDWSEGGGSDPWWLEAQFPVTSTELTIRARFLRVVDRTIERAKGDGSFEPVEQLDAAGRVFLPWEEGELCEIDLDVTGDDELSFILPGATESEAIHEDGAIVGRVVRARSELRGALRARFSEGSRFRKASVRLENLSEHPLESPRGKAMHASFASTHLLLSVQGGAFVSLRDPPSDGGDDVAVCVNTGTYPVLVDREVMLCAPIILEEPPAIAPESPTDLFDGGEIDELLILRTMTLTSDEKTELRATDARAAAMLEHVESLDEGALARLHGRTRTFAVGQRVRLRPGLRRTDAQDLLYAGHIATIAAIHEDVDGGEYFAVTIDDDPAQDLHHWYGRFHYFRPDEVEEVRS
jgi:hypothetical protein